MSAAARGSSPDASERTTTVTDRADDDASHAVRHRLNGVVSGALACIVAASPVATTTIAATGFAALSAPEAAEAGLSNPNTRLPRNGVAALRRAVPDINPEAGEVQSKLETAEQTDARINAAREEYRPVATRGSLLYFLITDMAAINVMYQVSLQQFLELFDYAIAKSDKAPLASKRILNIIELLSFHVTCYMQRGLFERHKQIWALMLTIKTQVVAGELAE